MILYLVRHAEADYDKEEVCGEFPGVPLTSLGHEQARQLVEKICSIEYDHVYCSDMRRTKETIAPSLDHLNQQPLYDSRIREISDAVVMGHEDNWFEEGLDEQKARVDEFIDHLKSLNGDILIVAHFGVIKYLSRSLGQEVEKPEYAGHYVLDFG